ncbi:hypothetical protein AX769_13160 [Frondihabitans sp. PAMC 28766]|uniref:preprotein translocase subunit YajC n=1 Tax=Frondihabitans sp. PAMC 28766 TaxID=1795630 RepID=UPI00078DC2E5|nr:preprotein translocase subunit YajC [Frondihabitans sp. PAMC 28766]AMM20915.1 hypothetical protein AX769_13160 [Frondihabitans sp. PAMC 28766]
MGSYGEYIILLILVVLIVVMFRNSRKKKRDQAELQLKMQPGSEIMLTFGLYGTLVSLDEENNVADVEIAPGTVIKVHRQTLGRVVEPVADTTDVTTATASTTGTESASSYSLNEDHAIPSAEPDFGERIQTNTTARDSDTHTN